MIKKKPYSLIPIACLIWLSVTMIPPSYASEPTPPPLPSSASPTATPTPGDEEIVSFTQLDFKDKSLRGPFDTTRLYFSLPAHWELIGGVELRLDLDIFFEDGGMASAADGGRRHGGALEVEFNNVALPPILLVQSGAQTITIPIPESALTPTRSDGRHELTFLLDSGVSCENIYQTNLVVRASSAFKFPHQLVSPTTDLAQFPRPIYQRSFLPDTAVIITPDQPTAGELQAALAVAAGLGRVTHGKLELSLTTAGQLDAATSDNHHLIFVGAASGFPMLEQVSLPAPVIGSAFDAASASPDDGIVQMAVSPWNPAKVVLVVGGVSEAGLIKAGQAVSSQAIWPGALSNLALVAQVVPEQSPVYTAVPDHTLAELGYETQTVERVGSNTLAYHFVVPSGYEADSDSYFDLIFTHSALLQYERSGLLVTLNDEPIGSARFSDESTEMTTKRIRIPRGAVRSGRNQLLVQADLMPPLDCVDERLGGLWLTVRSESTLHLPLETAVIGPAPVFDLSQYPEPFALNPTLSDTAFVLPVGDPAAWQAAAQIAFDLGYRSDETIADLVAVFGNDIPEEVRQGQNLLLVGRPGTHPLIAELEEALPVPFAAGSDTTQEQGGQVIYRLPSGTSLGYLELLPNPWNNERAILTVLGNSDEGVRWAGAALTTSSLRSQLNGNFAVINGDDIVAGNALPATGVAEFAMLPNAEEPAPSFLEINPVMAERAPWILPLLGASTLLMLVIIGAVFIPAWRRQRLESKGRAS